MEVQCCAYFSLSLCWSLSLSVSLSQYFFVTLRHGAIYIHARANQMTYETSAILFALPQIILVGLKGVRGENSLRLGLPLAGSMKTKTAWGFKSRVAHCSGALKESKNKHLLACLHSRCSRDRRWSLLLDLPSHTCRLFHLHRFCPASELL